MCEGLETHLKAEIVSVEHLKQGVTLKCTIQDLAAFLGALPNLPGIKQWSFNLNSVTPSLDLGVQTHDLAGRALGTSKRTCFGAGNEAECR